MAVRALFSSHTYLDFISAQDILTFFTRKKLSFDISIVKDISSYKLSLLYIDIFYYCFDTAALSVNKIGNPCTIYILTIILFVNL